MRPNNGCDCYLALLAMCAGRLRKVLLARTPGLHRAVRLEGPGRPRRPALLLDEKACAAVKVVLVGAILAVVVGVGHPAVARVAGGLDEVLRCHTAVHGLGGVQQRHLTQVTSLSLASTEFLLRPCSGSQQAPGTAGP